MWSIARNFEVDYGIFIRNGGAVRMFVFMGGGYKAVRYIRSYRFYRFIGLFFFIKDEEA